MKNHLHLKIHQFLTGHSLKSCKILVACSSGVDSMALLALLDSVKTHFDLKLAVAHVNHGWREESQKEFEYLKSYCHVKGIEFYGKELNLELGAKDAENLARQKRYEFFQACYQFFSADALVLGHHKQDLEETVVKRLYEGAHLLNLVGMQESSTVNGMRLMRPLLEIDKKQLIDFCRNEAVVYFEDRTNHDPRFLRSRMRQTLFPMLESVFLKNRQDSFIHLSTESAQLKEFFEKRFETMVTLTDPRSEDMVIHMPSGEIFEIKCFLLTLFKRLNLCLSRDLIAKLSEVVSGSRDPKNFQTQDVHITASRSFIFLKKTNASSNQSLKSHVNGSCPKLPKWLEKKLRELGLSPKITLNSYNSFSKINNN